MPRVKRTTEELEFALVQQLRLLRKACDGGFNDPWDFTEGINVAARLRVLLHHIGSDTNSNALLEQLKLREGRYLNTEGQGHTLTLPSFLGPWPRYLAPYKPWSETDMIPLDQWWEAVTISPAWGGPLISRKGLVLVISNQDGGAHIDDDIEEWVAILRRKHPTGWHSLDEDGTTQPIRGWEYGTVRCVGMELLWSLQQNHGQDIRGIRDKFDDTDGPSYPSLIREPPY